MSVRSRRARGATAAALVAALALPAASMASHDSSRGSDRDRGGKFATVKDDNKLVVFGGDRKRTYQIRGGGAELEDFVGIDVRPTGPSAGGLYGITRSGKIYLINPRNGSATFVSQTSTALLGASFGVDFNPVVDRLRVISDQDQNLRINVDTGAALTDAPLQYAAGDRNAGTNPAATGAGYTYAPFGGMTTLYDIETQADFLVIQRPPNNGTLNSVGSLDRDVQPNGVGFDIAGRSRFEAYGLFSQGDRAKLYEVDLRDGDTDSRGQTLQGSNYDGLAVLDGYADRDRGRDDDRGRDRDRDRR